MDIKRIPFSYPGSYYTMQYLGEGGEPEGLYIRSLHHDAWEQRAVQIITEHSVEEIQFFPHELCVRTEKGKVSFCFADPDCIAFRTEGEAVTFRYTKVSQVTERKKGLLHEVNCIGQNMKALLCLREGSVEITSDWDGDNCTKASHQISSQAEGFLYFERDRGSGISRLKEDAVPSYEVCQTKAKQEFDHWMEASAPAEEKYRKAYRMASYLNWSSFVAPYGQIPCETMYASKVSMLGIWSWDHCFHGIGILDADPEKAFTQWKLMFEKQAEDGALPDRMDDGGCYWTFTKPPVHGYFLTFMKKHGLKLTEEETRYAYEHLEKWTDYWFTYHDSDEDGVPEYDNGNDSGWDNNTVMVKGSPVESPDLSLWLILQMDCLAALAEELSMKEEAQKWKEHSRELTEELLWHFWDGEKECMTGRLVETHERVYSDSLILYLPLLLGERLPESIRSKMIADLKEEGEFLTVYGLASERLKSSWYSPDGYWRGPIWAPSTFLICEGLRECGEKEFAKELRDKFLSLCAEHMSMPENFNAKTGESLRDSALIWTASIFVRMAADKY